MNFMYSAIIMIASGILYFLPVRNYTNYYSQTVLIKDTIRWHERGAKWLVESQSKNGGWGCGSHTAQHLIDPAHVQTDPATTAFAAMALLKSGGGLVSNPYRKEILHALDRVLEDISIRPQNGKITALSGTQLQRKLGGNIDASLALEFLTEIKKQLPNHDYQARVDTAAKVCISLIEKSQAPNGSWTDVGWAPVLQSAMATNALEMAKTDYPVDDSVLSKSIDYHINNMETDPLKNMDGAGVPLYVAASAQRATAEDAEEAGVLLETAVVTGYGIVREKKEIGYAIESVTGDRVKAKRLAKAYIANKKATELLGKSETWKGFGNNGGEEYLSYKMSSEAMIKSNPEEWLKWKKEIESKFIASQNQNGSWSGHHCITSPVFCTAAVLLAWHAGE